MGANNVSVDAVRTPGQFKYDRARELVFSPELKDPSPFKRNREHVRNYNLIPKAPVRQYKMQETIDDLKQQLLNEHQKKKQHDRSIREKQILEKQAAEEAAAKVAAEKQAGEKEAAERQAAEKKTSEGKFCEWTAETALEDRRNSNKETSTSGRRKYTIISSPPQTRSLSRPESES